MSDERPITKRRRAFILNEILKDKRLNITVHRGTHQIGGCVTEYENNGWHLFVDYGEGLPGTKKTEPLKVEGLTHGDLSKSALLITHYHGDHIGCITELPKELPIYMGKVGCELQMVLSDHLKSKDDKQKQLLERLQQMNTFGPGKDFTFGPFKIVPVTIDHSAFDAYAFKIEANEVSVFHTGDFRTHGFRGKVLPNVIEKYIGRVDYVVCEGTNILRPDATSLTEPELQRQFEGKFREHKGSIVYLSSANIDRLFGLYHAAIRAGRPFIVDAYQKRMMDVVTQRDSIWGKSKLYCYAVDHPPMTLQYEDEEFRINDKFRYLLEQKGYVLIARANPRFDNFIERLPGEKHKILSMWEGYVEKSRESYTPCLSQSLGTDYEYMHTSGHCDMKSLREFFRLLNPKSIIPIHTDNPEDFANLFCDEFPVTVLNDGETISPISKGVFDACSARILCVKKPYKLDAPCLGQFKNFEDAKVMATHTRYSPQTLIGYEVMEEEDMWPFKVQIFDACWNLLSEYKYGGHSPRGGHYQEPCSFSKGEKVLALFYGGYNVVVPAIVLGPISLKFIRESFEQDEEWQEMCPTFEECKENLKEWNDWDWDKVAVQPLVKVEASIRTMTNIEFTQRIYLFPYRNLFENNSTTDVEENQNKTRDKIQGSN